MVACSKIWFCKIDSSFIHRNFRPQICPDFDPRKFLEIQRNLQAANALQSIAAVGGFFKSEENDSDEQVQHIKVEPDIH